MDTGSESLVLGEPAQPAALPIEDWVLQQLQRGCTPASMIETMQASGWRRDAAVDKLEQVVASARRAGVAVWGLCPRVKAAAGGRVWAHDREVQVVLELERPILAVVHQFLSAQECDELIALSRERLARSLTVVEATGDNQVHDARTSEGMFFERGEHALCERIEARIAELLQWPLDRGEGLQVLRYGPGAQYRPHHDYFEPERSGTAAILRRGGQRVGTLLMYLNSPQEGGETSFPAAGVRVRAVAGTAVFFAYPFAQPNSLSLHGGDPVFQGEKWVATKWMRECRFA